MKIVKPYLLAHFRAKAWCEWCGNPGAVDPHHIFGRGLGGGTRLDIRINLIALCRICHNAYHSSHIMRTDLLAKVAAREGMLQDDIVSEIYRLRRSPRNAAQEASVGEVPPNITERAGDIANLRQLIRRETNRSESANDSMATDEGSGWFNL